MGYMFYMLGDGREAGYGVEATCDHEACNAPIDRGMSYLCGELTRKGDGGEHGCGGYFCETHLYYAWMMPPETPYLCDGCMDAAMVESRCSDCAGTGAEIDGHPCETCEGRGHNKLEETSHANPHS